LDSTHPKGNHVNRNNSQIERLRGIETFSTCTTRELKQIDSLTTNLRAQPGRVLVREGGRALEFIVVLQGTATASREGWPIGRLGPGSLFGGSALLERGERSASVIADTDMELLVSSLNEFWTMYRSIPAVSQEMSAARAKRVTMADDEECAPCLVENATHGGPTKKHKRARLAMLRR
jgi:CRP-like cAMP-binding protein